MSKKIKKPDKDQICFVLLYETGNWDDHRGYDELFCDVFATSDATMKAAEDEQLKRIGIVRWIRQHSPTPFWCGAINHGEHGLFTIKQIKIRRR